MSNTSLCQHLPSSPNLTRGQASHPFPIGDCLSGGLSEPTGDMMKGYVFKLFVALTEFESLTKAAKLYNHQHGRMPAPNEQTQGAKMKRQTPSTTILTLNTQNTSNQP